MNPHRIGTTTIRILLVSTFVLSLALVALFYGEKSWAQKAGDKSTAQDGERRKQSPAKDRSEQLFGPFDYERFKEREKNGEFPSQTGEVQITSPYNSLTNNNGGATGTGFFTQSETTLVAFGNNVIVGFNDAGSNAGGTNKFTGFARSTNGGATFTDGGTLPTNPGGDAGDPVMARNETTGRIYFATLGFTAPGQIQVFRSDDNAVTWQAPVSGTPGGSSEDKQWMTVDNYAGAGNGNVYLVSRRFGAGPGIYFFRSTDHGATFGPNLGTLIVTGSQGAFVAVGPDHSVYVFWYAGATLLMRKSIDQGLTFGPNITVASGLVGGTNGDLGLTGQRQGTATQSAFRSNEFPHAVVSPTTGSIYVTFANNPAGADKADIFIVQSNDGGLTFGPAVRVNDDATTTDQWQPTIAITPDGNTLGVFYYSRQEDPAGNNLFKFYGRNAALAGPTTTFTPSYAISDVASLPEFGRDSVVNSVYMGDYDWAVATPGAFHVTWADNRDDLPGGTGRKDPNVYYKRIALTLAVTTTNPVVGSVINTPPTVFDINVTEPVNPATLQASDLTVNGIAATSVSYLAGSTAIQFSYASSPVTAQGIQTMNIAAGAFNSAAAGDPVAAFSGTFRFDVVTLQVISTVPATPGGVFTLPSPLTYDVNFNEAVDPSSVQTGDLQLSGIAGSSVTGVSVLPGNTTARFTLNVTAEGNLTANIAAGALTDIFGNPNAAFAGTYVVDIGTVSYPVPLLGKEPAGSLIYDPNATGNIGFAGDTDSFTLNIDPSQTISVIVTGAATLRPSIALRDPANNLIATASAGTPGNPTGIQTSPTTTGGVYTFTVGSIAGTTGNYTLQIILNSAFELEGLVPGATNNSRGTAQSIDASFVNLQTTLSTAQRGAVNGTSDNANYSAAAVAFSFEDISATGTVIAGLTNVDDTSVSIPIGFNFSLYGVSYSTVFVSSNGLLTFGTANSSFTNADLTTTPPQAAIAPYWDDQHTAGGAAGSNVFFQVSAPGPNQHLTIQWNQIRYFSGGTAGDTITYQAQLFADGRIQVNYQDLVSGAAAANNGASATLGIKDAGAQGPNRLLLAFNNGPNAFIGTGQSTLISPPAPTPDFYSFTLNAGDTTTLAIKNLGMTPVNIQLQDAGGSVLANGVAGATNLDQVISNFTAGVTGTYFARVSGVAQVPYDLVVTRNAAFDTEENNSFATAQPLGSSGALGSINSGGAYVATALPFTFEDISATGTVIAGLSGQDDAAASIPIGFNFGFYGVNYATVFVSSNGLLTFGSPNTSFTNADLTTTPAQAAIAPFWDDQIVNPGTVLFQVTGSGANQHLTIQWNQIQFFSGGTAGDNITYQVQLFADGRIQVNYQDLVSGAAAANNGASATLGIKDVGTQGINRLLLAFNNGPNAFIGTGKSTLISRPVGDDWYSVSATTGQPLNFDTITPADGPGEFVNLLNPHIELFDPSGVSVASGITLADGRNEIITHTAGSTGVYRIRVSRDGDTVGEYFLGTSFNPPPTVVATGSTLVQESCAPANGAIDPGERDGVNLQITNISGSPIPNVVGTLQPGGGVIAPTGPVDFGTLPAGGSASRMFTFTASTSVPPGGTITATLQLQSGATNLGTVVYNFIAGPAPCGGLRLTTSAVFTRIDPATVQAVITVQNAGTLPASNVMLNTARLGVVNGSPLPQSLGTLGPGASTTATVTFANNTPGPTNLTTGVTYTGGSLNATRKYNIP